MLDNYVIIGKRLEDDDIFYLHSDGSHDLNPEKDGTPGTALTVDFIGRKLVELSQKPELVPGTPEHDRQAHLIKLAMKVETIDAHDPEDPELKEIWDNTTIEIGYDQRIKQAGQTDKNIRKLIVPAAEALVYKQQKLAAGGSIIGFQPPLTYILDRMLWQSYLKTAFSDAIDEYRDDQNHGLPPEVKEKLLAVIDQKFGKVEDLADSSDPTEAKIYEILSSPESAFYRAVGIYITSMCN